MSKRVLIHGVDATLLETRRQILVKEGFAVDKALNDIDLAALLDANPPDLLIVCSSLDRDVQRVDVALAHARNPKVKCLVVDAGLSDSCTIADSDATFPAFSGADRFVNEVRLLLVR